MNNNFSRWAVIAGALLLAAIVGTMAYNAGVTRGIEQSGKIVVAPVGAVPVPYPYYYGYRPWGGGFFLTPFLFIAFWFVVARAMFRRGGWQGGGCGAEGRLDEWHRRMHERMANGSAGGGTTER